MAQRFGGKFSPDSPSDKRTGQQRNAYDGASRTRAGGRVNLLFIAPLPLIYAAFTTGPTGLALNLIALGMLLLAAWMTREGLKAEEAYEARKVARRPGVPRKLIGGVVTGLGLAVAGVAAGASLIEPIIYAITGAVLHSFAFGLDPMKDKGMEGIDTFQTDRVARAVDAAEQHLQAMNDALKRVNDRNVRTRVEQFQRTVRDLFRIVEADPRDLTAARKYLSVYLQGARDATVKFVDIFARSGDHKARTDYLALLDDLEQNFAARTEKLLLDDRSDLEVEIEVLRDRLAREGLSTTTQND
ncbi:5-bromo-4-chloroindolyl phosphate hydrolysis protein [Roseovarius albus]|uniref:5-bromo-4-chloroindolyl phosphate hydrolysis protein n=1 Tax=Roseovarius albus TaxID=1247867 RepID=A0A1X6YGB1_9RHOB|nr:5-bromo-4-chloroindolyl phosphate hydrolysis family protein [Roseovarius albus]SLN20837.1 5-bromo-4-chloroindolyl phosphate hydrolysis protein [Roseovarius albus]